MATKSMHIYIHTMLILYLFLYPQHSSLSNVGLILTGFSIAPASFTSCGRPFLFIYICYLEVPTIQERTGRSFLIASIRRTRYDLICDQSASFVCHVLRFAKPGTSNLQNNVRNCSYNMNFRPPLHPANLQIYSYREK